MIPLSRILTISPLCVLPVSYIFINSGFNLRPTDIQAAIGRIQLKKLPEFIKKRKENFEINNYFIFTICPSAGCLDDE